MSADPMTDVYAPQMSVEQMIIMFGGDGASVVASSMRGLDIEQGWLDALQPYLGANVGLEDVTSRSLAYIRFTDNWAAVLMSAPATGGTSATAVIHALLGRADLLTSGLALTLSQWPGWQHGGPDDYLSSLRPDQLRQSIDVAGTLRARVLSDADRLVRVLSWLFQNPAAPLDIVGCPVPDRVPLLWGLAERVRRCAPVVRGRSGLRRMGPMTGGPTSSSSRRRPMSWGTATARSSTSAGSSGPNPSTCTWPTVSLPSSSTAGTPISGRVRVNEGRRSTAE